MNYIILGASGQVGAAIINNLVKQGAAVTGVIRDEAKAADVKKMGADVAIADATDADALASAFKQGDVLFVLTPEESSSKDVLGETKAILANYRQAAEASAIKKIIGLSSIGAQHASGTGNLIMSYLMEHAFEGLPVDQAFIRPAYYFSNWLPYLDVVKKEGVLPTFYPPEMAMPMISPMDVAKQVSQILTGDAGARDIYELEGPAWYTSADVAAAFSAALNKPVKAQQIPRNKWEETLKGIGFSPDAIKNFVEMTDAAIAGRAKPEGNGTIRLRGETTLQEYITEKVNNT